MEDPGSSSWRGTYAAFGTEAGARGEPAAAVARGGRRGGRSGERLHGAFTGGWSAGYYGTVGSRE